MNDNIRHSTIENELKSGNTVTYYTVGVSMQPLLSERETIVVIAPKTAKKNDIVLYIRENGQYVLHRLKNEDNDFYYMRGDNTYPLERVEKSQAIGVVTHIHRKGRVIDVEASKGYKLYVLFWNFIYPVRLLLWKCKLFAIRAVRRIKKYISKGGKGNGN